MKLWKLFLVIIIVTMFESFILQLTVRENDIAYPLLPLGSMEITGFYSPTSSLVDITFSGQGDGNYTIIDLDNLRVIQKGRLENKVVRIALQHPGYYGIIVNGSYSGSATMKVIDVGFPEDNWRFHLLFLSLCIVVFSIGVWREKA
ncbi:hypothetical protein [Pyrococcus kukulkanii]|uniref:Uncharacterized protein n=1 Tax=Pyrococcus kukulkanii TaxID=1609559 RepID=A0A127BBH9_9EURY|nr:hypothetical protein [Pyrococcus kukulkanii]AMM54690.1 hypothetical protein TQ32_09470 [Pyrococcus kukulkanii]